VHGLVHDGYMASLRVLTPAEEASLPPCD